jgi:hypothetical protein
MLYAKALVPLLVTPILFLLQTIGITPGMSVEEAITFIITMGATAAMVYLVPNKK